MSILFDIYMVKTSDLIGITELIICCKRSYVVKKRFC